MGDRAAEARAEAERRWFPGHDHEDCIKCGIDVQVREGFELGVVWADANPKPHTITREDLGGAADEFTEAGTTGEWVSIEDMLIEALGALGIEVEDSDE